MDMTEPGQEPTAPRPGRRTSITAGLAGAVVGVGAAVGGLVLLTGGAGAQPTVANGSASTAPAQQVVIDDAGDVDGDTNGDVVDLDDLELEFGEELEAHMACIDERLADNGIDVDTVEDGDEPELTEAEWEALEADLATCDDLLPADWVEMDEAFEAFDQCLIDNGVIEDHDGHGDEDGDDEYDAGDDEDGEHDDGLIESGAFVLFETEDGSTFVEFGDGDGEVTIAKADGELAIETEGDVVTETLTWDELDDEAFEEWGVDEAAFEECEALLPDFDR